MTLLWPQNLGAVVTDQPRLHALVIGVANYPHLIGGKPDELAADPLGLSQITTPDPTVRRIARWLIDDFKNDACPIGSVELLMSPAGTVPGEQNVPVQVDGATMAAVQKATNEWFARCSSSKDNIALFYFCGHGLAKDSQYLLPEDFGNPGLADVWQNCIDFDATRVGMRRCKAQTQLYFIDACRETPFGVLSQMDVSGHALVSGAKFSDTVRCSAAYYATTEGKKAFGPADDVTYFGQAVVHCLNGLGASNAKGKWTVTSYSLSAALGQVMQHYAETYEQPLDCNPDVSGQGIIHHPAQASVLATIECTSGAANAAADIELRRGALSHRSPVGQPKPLSTEVPPGDWEVIVQFPGGEFAAPAPLSFTLIPPVFEGVEVP